MQKKRFVSYLVLTLMIGVFAFAFAFGQTVNAADAPVASHISQVEGNCGGNSDSDPILYDQKGTVTPSGNGQPTQNFEAAFNIYDSESADDFVVDGDGWHVSGMDICGTWSAAGPLRDVTVTIYDDNAGEPGSAVCTYDMIAPDTATNDPNVEVDFPSDCSLVPGTYWASLIINMDFGSGGQHFWSNAVDSVTNPSHWRNPGDGFGSGCTDWDASTTCGVGGGTNPSLLFSINGTAASPTDVSLSSFDGGSNSSAIAAIIVGIFSLGVAALVTIRYRLSQDQVA